MKTEADKPIEFCELCHIGSLQPHRTTFARWHNGQFVIVPKTPAWRCDFCGDIIYDDTALSQLVLLLGPESNPADQRQWRTTGLDESRKTRLGDRRQI